MEEAADQDNDWRTPRPYQRCFEIPTGTWSIAASWEEAYFLASRDLILRVSRAELNPEVEGIAGIYLFRHYLELALKFLLLHTRLVRRTNEDALSAEVESVRGTHSLSALWALARAEFSQRFPERWELADVAFVENCIQEFDGVDPHGQRFRYHAAVFASSEQHAEAWRRDFGGRLEIDYAAIANQMDHVSEVLGQLDAYAMDLLFRNGDLRAIINTQFW